MSDIDGAFDLALLMRVPVNHSASGNASIADAPMIPNGSQLPSLPADPAYDRDIVDSSWDIPVIDFRRSVRSVASDGQDSLSRASDGRDRHTASPASGKSIGATRAVREARHAAAKPFGASFPWWCGPSAIVAAVGAAFLVMVM